MPHHRLGGELYSSSDLRNAFLLNLDLKPQVTIKFFFFFLGLSAAQRKFAHSLRDFKFEFIGDAETDDERCIGT